jgi:hypothetical protein
VQGFTLQACKTETLHKLNGAIVFLRFGFIVWYYPVMEEEEFSQIK